MNDLGLVKPVDGLGERVVVAIADAAHRRLNPGLKKPFRIFYRDILAAPVAVMDQAAAMQGPPVMRSLLQRIKYEPHMRRTADTPANDPARKRINDEGDINKASPGRDGAFSNQAERLAARKIRPSMPDEVRDPKRVRHRSLEFLIDVIPWTGGCLVRKGRAQGPPANCTLNPIRAHQARNGTARDTETFST